MSFWKKTTAKVAVPSQLKGKRPTAFEYLERSLAVHRLRRAGHRVDQIAELLGISTRSVRRAIATRNKLAKKTLTVNVEADLKEDWASLTFDSGRIDASLSTATSPRDVAALTRARAHLLKTKHELLRDLGIRRQAMHAIVDDAQLAKARLLSDEALEERRAQRTRAVLQAAGLRPVKLKKDGRSVTVLVRREDLLELEKSTQEGRKASDHGS